MNRYKRKCPWCGEVCEDMKETIFFADASQNSIGKIRFGSSEDTE